MLTKDEEYMSSRILTLLAELDSAAALMASAKASKDADTIQRYREGAYRSYQGSYQAAMGLILGTQMTDREEHEVWNRVGPIQRWLEAARLLKH